MVVDCFTFFNEIDVLKIRLATHSEFVDKFVIIEGKQTHSGLEKESNFLKSKDLFKEYLGKIEYYFIDINEKIPSFPSRGYPNTIDWIRENFQRNQLLEKCKDLGLQDNDIVINSDCDEIISSKEVENIKNMEAYSVLQKHYAYKLNLFCGEDTDGPKIGYWKIMKNKDWSSLRTIREFPTIKGGWHFSFLYRDAFGVYNKFKSFAHNDDNPDVKDPEYAKDKVIKCLVKSKVEIDESYPKYITDNLDKMKELIE